MTKRRKNKKRAKNKPIHETVRNWVALSACLATGAGRHLDGRLRRRRSRAMRKRAALAEYDS
jgi:hypothetical protein